MTAPLRSRAIRRAGVRPAPARRALAEPADPPRHTRLALDLRDGGVPAIELGAVAPGPAPGRLAEPATGTASPAPPARSPAPAGERTTLPEHDLASALADLAEVCAVYPFRAAMPVCPHCVSDAELRALGRTPARIPATVLDRYVAKALVTWGDVPDLKRLLPEVLHRSAAGTLGPPAALVGARLRRAGWLGWPAAETPAVRRALAATWLSTLSTAPGPGRTPLVRALGLVASAEDDLRPYLEVWEDRLESPGDPAARLAAVLHLSDLLAPLADGGRRRLARTLPLARRGVIGQLDQWLRLPVVSRRLAHAGDALQGTPHEGRVTRARAGMARLRTDR